MKGQGGFVRHSPGTRKALRWTGVLLALILVGGVAAEAGNRGHASDKSGTQWKAGQKEDPQKKKQSSGSKKRQKEKRIQKKSPY
jgi:hypothetical protein